MRKISSVVRLTSSLWKRNDGSRNDILYSVSRWCRTGTGRHLLRSTAAATWSPPSYTCTAYTRVQPPDRTSQIDSSSNACLPACNCDSSGTHAPRCAGTGTDRWWRHTRDLTSRHCHTRTLLSTRTQQVHHFYQTAAETLHIPFILLEKNIGTTRKPSLVVAPTNSTYNNWSNSTWSATPHWTRHSVVTACISLHCAVTGFSNFTFAFYQSTAATADKGTSWTLTYNLDLRIWPRKGQGKTWRQISTSKIISFKRYCSTHVHTYTLSIAVSGTLVGEN